MLTFLSLKLIDTEDQIQSQFEMLGSKIKAFYDKSMTRNSIYDDPCTEISMSEKIPNAVEFYSCTNQILLKDWEDNMDWYLLNENPIMLDMKIVNVKI